MPYYNQKPNSRYSGYKKPVKSFQDLEVYQKSLEVSVFVAKDILPKIIEEEGGKKKGERKKQNEKLDSPRELIYKSLAPCVLGLPHLIAEAHSIRFGSKEESIVMLERVMLSCNKLVVYLEQVRDICETDTEWENFDELIKKIFDIRRKVLHLQMSWKKYMLLDKEGR